MQLIQFLSLLSFAFFIQEYDTELSDIQEQTPASVKLRRQLVIHFLQ